jgi:hypothetical protein
VVVVTPSLSTETTCCGWPVAIACFLACSSAFSCFEAHPNMPAAKTSVNAGTLLLRIHQENLNIFVYPSLSMISTTGKLLLFYELRLPRTSILCELIQSAPGRK